MEVCTDDLPTVAAEAGVVSIPTIQMYANQGVVQDTIVGCVAKAVLRTAVDKVLDDWKQQQQQLGGVGTNQNEKADNESSSSNEEQDK